MIIGYENGRHKISFSASRDPHQHPYEENGYFTLRSLRALHSEITEIFSKIEEYSIRVFGEENFKDIKDMGVITYKHLGSKQRGPMQGDIFLIDVMSEDDGTRLVGANLFEINSSKFVYNSDRGDFDYLLEISEL